MLTTLEYAKEHQNEMKDYHFSCHGQFTYANTTIQCYHGSVHGEEDFKKSFAKSCNTSFANIGVNLDRDAFGDTLDGLLFNSKLPMPLPYKESVLQVDNSISNDDMIQVRLYDSLDKCYYKLGTPVSMGCALSLLKRFHDTPRPEEICLDDDIKRFRGFHAELTTYYPGRYSDYANGVLSLIAPYRYTCKKCEMGENHSANMQTCANNIMSGKCRDEFVRQTVGVTLFPEHYANQKQR
jgi:hypothetical protein